MILACRSAGLTRPERLSFFSVSRNHQVGQEAGHGLLGAAIGIAGEIAERGEETAGNRRSDLEVQRVRGGIGVRREVDGGVGRGVLAR